MKRHITRTELAAAPDPREAAAAFAKQLQPAQHTPGPWTLLGDSRTINGPFPNRNPKRGYRDLIAVAESGNVGADEAKANARLIASAPELLAALRAIETCADAPENYTLSELTRKVRGITTLARAALTKAGKLSA